MFNMQQRFGRGSNGVAVQAGVEDEGCGCGGEDVAGIEENGFTSLSGEWNTERVNPEGHDAFGGEGLESRQLTVWECIGRRSKS
jgi:hypothetical protein